MRLPSGATSSKKSLLQQQVGERQGLEASSAGRRHLSKVMGTKSLLHYQLSEGDKKNL